MVADRGLFLNYTNHIITGNMCKLLSIKNPSPGADYTTEIPVAKEPAGTKFLIRPLTIAVVNTDFPPLADPKTYSWRSILINGIIASGGWIIRCFLWNPTKYEVTVKLHVRLSYSSNPDGSNATLICTHVSPNYTILGNSGAHTKITTPNLDVVNLVQQYLFVEFVLEIVTPAGSVKAYLQFVINSGPDAGVTEAFYQRVQTPKFSSTWKSEEGPTASTGAWTNPHYATEYYPSDDKRASAILDQAQIYGYYHHQETIPLGSDILQVLIEPEHCEPDGAFISLEVSGDGGTSWGILNALPSYEVCDVKTLVDVTDQWSWDWSSLTDENFRCRVKRQTTGCLHPDVEVGLFDFDPQSFLNLKKKAKDVKVGDVLIGWENGQFLPAKVTKVKILKGNWKFVRIICYYNAYLWAPQIRRFFDLSSRDFGEKDIVVTANHPLWENTEAKYIPAGELQVGQVLSGLFTDKIEDQNPHYILAPCPIKKIETFTGKRCIHIETDKKHMFAHFRLQEIIKW